MKFRSTKDDARGKWAGILSQLGVPVRDARGKNLTNVPCPMCGGRDRFSFLNTDGHGTWFCRKNCGGGDGFMLLMLLNGWEFRQAAAEVDKVLGNVATDPAPQGEMTPQQLLRACQSLWSAGQPIKAGDAVDAYLASRHLDEVIYPAALRSIKAARDGEGGSRPAMLARVTDPAGQDAAIHRTFLEPSGCSKALGLESPRKLLGRPPPGSCIRLGAWSEGPLGIAEGIETAMAASNRFQTPVWAAINTRLLEKWTPPPDCRDVLIFGDRDLTFAGERAAYILAERLALAGLDVAVHVPPTPGEDWSDVWRREQAAQSRADPNAAAA